MLNRGVYKPPTAQRVQLQQKYDQSCDNSEKYKKRFDPNFADLEGRNHLHLISLHGLNGDDCSIDNAVKSGCLVNAQDKHGCRPLHYAVDRNHIGCLKKLIQHGAELNVLNRDGMSPLMLAAKRGAPEAMKILIKAGAKVTMENEQGESAIHYAVRYNKLECLEIYLQVKGNVNARDKRGKTGMIVATEAGNLNVVDVLVSSKADVNITDEKGRSALHWAAENGRDDCARLLIQANSKLDVADRDGDTPYVIAIKCNNSDVLQILIDAGCDRSSIDGLMGTSLALAAIRGNLEVTEVLLDNGEDPDEYGYFGMTPLMLAAFESHVDVVDVLLQKGADPNVVGRKTGRALHKALMKLSPSNEVKRHSVVARLIRANVDVNARVSSSGGYFTACTDGKNCPLSFAIAAGYISLVRMLLVAGAEVSQTEIKSWMELNNIRRFFDFCQLLDPIMEWKQQPLPLKHICRAVIRKSIIDGRRMEASIDRLPVAPSVKEYLNFDELENVPPERASISEGANPGMMNGLEVAPCGLKALEGTLLHRSLQPYFNGT